jgi:hypothetical protein
MYIVYLYTDISIYAYKYIYIYTDDNGPIQVPEGRTAPAAT